VRLRRSAQHLKASLREWGKICVEQQGKLDLVLTDLVMPGQDGHRLASELAEKYPAISVLFMSGCTDDSASRRDILLDGSPFLQKPFSVAELANAVHNVLLLKRVTASREA